MARTSPWIQAHVDHADAAFSMPLRGQLESIRDRLATFGYGLKLDIGKRVTTATVSSATLKAKSTYPSLALFIEFEEARLAKMEART